MSWETTKVGIIKFVGKTDFAEGEQVGLILESAVSDSHVGSKDGKQYF